MLNFGNGTHIYATFEADGTVDLDDKQHLLDCYSGIAFAGAPTDQLIAQSRSTFRFVFSRIFGRVN